MKKAIYFFLFVGWCSSSAIPQNINDDLYFVPSKNKQETKKDAITTTAAEKESERTTEHIYTNPGTTIIIRNQNQDIRDVDEYNRRHDANYDYSAANDTLYIDQENSITPNGEWVTGEFDGSESDYEYAARIIRFRNPRFAISISSPLYWDLVYGPGAWDWNIYVDGAYAYAFPTWSNPLWWDWRYNSFWWD